MTRFESVLSALALGAAMIGSVPAFASDTFPLYVGEWAGEGTISWKSDGSKERMKCAVTYALGPSSDELALKFDCKSDNYVFNLDGTIKQDGDNVKGQWSERSRNIGGSAIGQVKGEMIRLRIESSSAFYANLQMVVKNNKQQVLIKSAGAGEEATSEFTLKKIK
jgi:hypothetical protein